MKITPAFIALILLLALLSVSFNLPAQGNTKSKMCLKEDVLRFNFLGVAGVSYEMGIGGGFTFRPEIGLGWPLVSKQHDAEGNSNLHLESPVNPYALLEWRYYYNLEKRDARSKPTGRFSGNYIGIFYRYNALDYRGDYFSDNSVTVIHDVIYAGGWWGLQRNIGKRELFFVNFSIGPGLKTNFKDYTVFAPSAALGFGLQMPLCIIMSRGK